MNQKVILLSPKHELTHLFFFPPYLGSLFWLVNRTATAFGARMLRKWIEQPLVDKKYNLLPPHTQHLLSLSLSLSSLYVSHQPSSNQISHYRAIDARLDSVTELMDSESKPALAILISTIHQIPDLERGKHLFDSLRHTTSFRFLSISLRPSTVPLSKM